MAAAPTDAGAGEQAGPSTTKADSIELNAEKQRQVAEDVWDGFRLQLRDTEFLVKKAGVVSRMEEKMRAEYDAKGTEIGQSDTSLPPGSQTMSPTDRAAGSIRVQADC